MTDVRKVALARSFQNIAFRQLEEKLVLALSWCQQNLRKGLSLEHVVVSGGLRVMRYCVRGKSVTSFICVLADNIC